MNNIKEVKQCRICKTQKLYQFLDLGKQPIPNGFLKKENLKEKENFFKLACFFCQNCGLVQLTHIVSPSLMFQNYVYVPSGAKIMMNNFSNLSYYAYKKLKLNKESLVLDIGSNDGSLLTFFKRLGVKVLGIDPAENLKKAAEQKGIPTMVGLFNPTLAKRILSKVGEADLITATNVIAHIDNLHQTMKSVSMLLKKDGLFITEFPYLVDLLDKNQFDTIYHEHLSYFSIKPWKSLIEKFGFEIVNVQRLLIHGGSIRLIHRKKKGFGVKKAVNFLLDLEKAQGLYNLNTYNNFTKKVLSLKNELSSKLKDFKRNGKRIVGIGAAAKGNVLTNFFQIGPDILDYIVDSTELKHGLYTPGQHIPVYPESELMRVKPDYALILAWNFADEIMKKHEAFKKNGGKFIIPIPEVKIV